MMNRAVVIECDFCCRERDQRCRLIRQRYSLFDSVCLIHRRIKRAWVARQEFARCDAAAVGGAECAIAAGVITIGYRNIRDGRTSAGLDLNPNRRCLECDCCAVVDNERLLC